jgi:hypothetical protein
LILPDPPKQYSREDQAQLRRILIEAGTQVPDFSTLKTVPPAVVALTTIPTISPLALLLLGDTTETAMRLRLLVKEQQSSFVLTTGTLADGAAETGTLTIPDLACDLVAIEVDRKCWVTLYASAAARTADGARVLPTRPTAGTGVLAEFVATVAGTIPGSPPPRLINGDGTGGAALNKLVYYRIQNMSGASHTVQVTFHFGALP